MTKPQLWPVFICYRRVDGSAAARRLHEILDKWQTTGPEGQTIQLDAYLDETMPGVADWKEMHRPYLEKARAILVICTPGAWINEGSDDWVHMEIDWWLEHREAAPILIDPLMEGSRYVPNRIAERWPDIQRIPLVEKEWRGLADAELAEKTAAVGRQILGAILPSGAEVYAQELQEERLRATKLKRALAVSVLLLASAVLAGGYAAYQRAVALENERVSQAALLDSRAADRFGQSRLIDARRQVDAIRRDDLLKRLEASEVSGARRSNLLHELDQIEQDLERASAQRARVLSEGRGLIESADAAWGELDDKKKRIRLDPPHVLSIELIQAGSGESLLVHYGTPDRVRLVMINAGRRKFYREFIRPRLLQLAASRFGGGPLPIELFVVGDRDYDKTQGLSELLEDLLATRGTEEQLVDIQGIWANIFRAEGGKEGLRPHIRRLIGELELPLNEPFDHLVMRPDDGRGTVTLAGGLEIVVLGPERSLVADLYAHSRRNAEDDGASIEPLPEETFATVELAFEPSPLSAPQPAAEGDGTCVSSDHARRLAGGRYLDRSVANLASTILLLRYQGKTFLYTGDGRGDKILEGLAAARLLDSKGQASVDLLTIPHAGSDRNITVDFFERVRAAGYLFSGDGTFENPEVATVAALIHARSCDSYRMYFVNRSGANDEHGAKLDDFFQGERSSNPRYRRVFRSPERGSVMVDLLDPVRD